MSNCCGVVHAIAVWSQVVFLPTPADEHSARDAGEIASCGLCLPSHFLQLPFDLCDHPLVSTKLLICSILSHLPLFYLCSQIINRASQVLVDQIASSDEISVLLDLGRVQDLYTHVTIR